MLYFLHVQWLSVLNLPYTVKLAGLLKNICVFFSSTNKHIVWWQHLTKTFKNLVLRDCRPISLMSRNKNPMQTADSLLGKTGGRRRGWQRMTWLERITSSLDMNLGKRQEMVRDGAAWRAAVRGVAKSQTHVAIEQHRSKNSLMYFQKTI